MSVIPRFQGNAIQIGKHWSWEMYIRVGDTEPIVLAAPEARQFLNKDAALNDLREQIAILTPIVCKAMGLPKPTEYIDLNKNQSVSFETFSKPTTFKGEA